MINIVVFGPVHSGKSTLMGYIRAHSMSAEERKKTDKQIKKELDNKGAQFKDEDKYTYYISMDRDEITPDSKKDSIGTTKRMHIKNITNIPHDDVEADLIFIDTPGQNTEKLWKDRYEGIFMGDIGVFVVDINEIINLGDLNRESEEYAEEINRLFSYLFLWRTTKQMKNVMIVLSKIDTVNSTDDILYAEETIEQIGYFKDVLVIPIGIDFKNDSDYNIFNAKEEENSQSIVFIKKLFEFIDIKRSSDKRKNINLTYLEGIKRINETNEMALQVKVLEGHLVKNMDSILLPVKRRNDSEFGAAAITIKELQLVEDRKTVTEMVASNIGSILSSKILFHNKRVDLNELSLVKTTCIIGKNTRYITGNLLSFKTPIYERPVFTDNFLKIRINQKINIVWFGKVISASFCSRYKRDNYYYFNAYLREYPIVMPVDDDKKYSTTRFALEVNNSYFFQAELESINNLNRDSDKIYISFYSKDVSLSQCEIENFLGIVLKQRGGNYETWIDIQKNDFEIISKQFGKFVDRFHVQEYIYMLIGSDGEIQDCKKNVRMM